MTWASRPESDLAPLSRHAIRLDLGARRNGDGTARYKPLADNGRAPAGGPVRPPTFSRPMAATYTPASVTQELLFHLARIPGAVHRDKLAEAVGTSKDYAGRKLSELVRLGAWSGSGAGRTT